ASFGRLRVDVRAKPLVGDGGVRALDERRDLSIAHLTVTVRIGRAVQARSDFVAEHAGLDAGPFMALARRRRPENEPDGVALREPRERAKPVDLVALPTWTSAHRQEVRIASVDDEVRLLGVHLAEDHRLEIGAVELGVLERDVPAPVLHVAVPRVDEVE